eukprot:m.147336 g.147336  ORF g.147336 m.147336 type:complete len:438 (-) comp14984_c0_seq11:214-1527(-)
MVDLGGAVSNLIGGASSIVDHWHHRESTNQSAALHRHAIKQDKVHHAESISQAEEHFRSSIFEAQTLHKNEMEQARAHHYESLFESFKQHDKEFDLAERAANRENLRDVWQQKSRKVDTLLITTTLMFSCFVALLCEGLPPASVHENEGYTDANKIRWTQDHKSIGLNDVLIFLWAIIAGITFSILAITINLILSAQERMSFFNIYDKDCRYKCIHKVHVRYEDYYDCQCKRLVELAGLGYNVGTMGVVILGTITLFSRFWIQYFARGSAIIFASIMATCVLTIVIFEMAKSRNPRVELERTDDADPYAPQETVEERRQQFLIHKALIEETYRTDADDGNSFYNRTPTPNKPSFSFSTSVPPAPPYPYNSQHKKPPNSEFVHNNTKYESEETEDREGDDLVNQTDTSYDWDSSVYPKLRTPKTGLDPIQSQTLESEI